MFLSSMEGVPLGDGSGEALGSYTRQVCALDVGEHGVRETRHELP